ncbi:MAG: WhiB family transcriptional regulator [Candidatus Saccharimonadales bacterium]
MSNTPYIPGEAIGGCALEMLRDKSLPLPEKDRRRLRKIVMERAEGYLKHYRTDLVLIGAPACQEMPEIFSPKRGEAWVADIARAACHMCVVQVSCSRSAVDDTAPYIRAGMTSDERKRARNNDSAA